MQEAVGPGATVDNWKGQPGEVHSRAVQAPLALHMSTLYFVLNSLDPWSFSHYGLELLQVQSLALFILIHSYPKDNGLHIQSWINTKYIELLEVVDKSFRFEHAFVLEHPENIFLKEVHINTMNGALYAIVFCYLDQH